MYTPEKSLSLMSPRLPMRLVSAIQSNFTKCFKKEFDVTPTEYQKKEEDK